MHLGCPSSPNCVSSQATQASHRVEPLRYRGDAEAALQRLAALVSGLERSTIVRRRPDYLHVEFRSRVFGFVDDVEFVSTRQGVLDVRSKSRSGHYDFGVNRRRVEAIRAAFER